MLFKVFVQRSSKALTAFFLLVPALFLSGNPHAQLRGLAADSSVEVLNRFFELKVIAGSTTKLQEVPRGFLWHVAT